MSFPQHPPPTQTTGSPFNLLQQRLISGTTHNAPSCPLASYLVSQPRRLYPPSPPTSHRLRDNPTLPLNLQLASFSLPLPSQPLFTEANRIKTDNVKIFPSSFQDGVGDHRLLEFSFLFKMENARILYLFQSTPRQFRPLTWELLGDRDQAPTFLSSQGRACHQPPKVLVGSVGAHQSFRASTLFCPLSINDWASFQKHKPVNNTKLWLFSVLKMFHN